MQTKEKQSFILPKISEQLGLKREQFHPDQLLSDPDFPLDYLETRPEDPYEAWNRPDLREFTDQLGSAWEEILAERYNMETIRNGPVDLRVTEGVFEGSPVQAKSACVINKRGTRADGTVKSQPGQLYIKKPEMESLAHMDLSETSLDIADYSPPALLHGSVHYPQEDMPTLPKNIRTATITPNDGRNYSFETAYIGEIIAPIPPLYEENNDVFNTGERQAWPLSWQTAFGENEEDENIMKYWRD